MMSVNINLEAQYFYRKLFSPKQRCYEPSFVRALIFLLLVICTELAAILFLNSGHFVYTLDDPYIHLALAENLINGHYGVNSNEYSAPSSSNIWPFLIAPFARLPFAHYVPFIINVLSAIGTLLIFWKILVIIFSKGSGNTKRINSIITVFLFLLIPASNLVGLIFTGMEHSLQVFFVTLIMWGLISELEEDKKPPLWLFAAIIIAPLVRYENFAVSLPALFFLFVRGHRKDSIITAVIMLLLASSFSVFLWSLGLEVFPTSIIAKLGIITSEEKEKNLYTNLRMSLKHSRGILLFTGTAFLFLCALLCKKNKIKERLFALSSAVAITFHLLVGQYGWYCRYEIYIWVVTMLAVLYVSKDKLSIICIKYPLKSSLIVTVVILIICIRYVGVISTTPIASNNIYEQQYQMHRFAVEFYKKPVAVNDLGYVSFRNDKYVLDLWGLASVDALKQRKENKNSDWMDRISKTYNIKLVMIYDTWFRDKLPDNWYKAAELHLGKRKITPAASVVSFYITDGNHKEVYDLMYDFQKTLPQGVKFTVKK